MLKSTANLMNIMKGVKMTRTGLCVILVCAICTVGWGAENTEKKPEQSEAPLETKLPPKDSATYWVVRSQTMTELIPFLTKKRSEFKGHFKMITQYLDKIGKGEDFLKSGIKAPNTPAVYAEALGISDEIAERNVKLPDKPLTWDQVVEFGMGHVIYEGYMPTDVSGEEELEMIKKICKQKEKYGQKVRKEMREDVKRCLNIWTYLGTINKQEEARVYAFMEKDRLEKARREELNRRREDSAEISRQRREAEKRNAWQRRQNLLNDRYNRSYYYYR
jgi:hypothetical protein